MNMNMHEARSDYPSSRQFPLRRTCIVMAYKCPRPEKMSIAEIDSISMCYALAVIMMPTKRGR